MNKIFLMAMITFVIASPQVYSYQDIPSQRRIKMQSAVKGFSYFFSDVGAEIVHHDPDTQVKIISLLPLPEPNLGHIEDFNFYQNSTEYPKLFTLSDSTFSTPFIFVDNRPNSELNLWLKKIAADLKSRLKSDKEIIEELKFYISNLVLQPVPENDLILNLFSNLRESSNHNISELDHQIPGNYPVKLNKVFPTVTIFDVINYKRGFCIHKALLTSLLLNELNINNKLRFGSTGLSGHTWIELENNVVLDPTWNLLVEKKPHSKKGSENLNKFFNHNGTDIFVLQYYPFAVWNY